MLGLAVTLVCGTQATVFASDVEGETQVAVETETKETAKEEVKAEAKEEVVTGTEVVETPVVEEATEKVAGTEELVGLGVSVEAEAETPETAKEEADEQAVPQADVEAEAETPAVDVDTTAQQADTEVETPSTETETDEQTPAQVAEPKLSITANTTTFDGTQDIVLTLKAEFDDSVEFYQDMVTLDGVIVGNVPEQVSDKEMRITVTKDGLQRAIAANHYENGQTAVLSTGYSVGYRDESGVEQEVAFHTITLTYFTGDTDNGGDNNNGNNGGGTETPDPEQPENPDNGNGDNGNTETPDPEQPENPDNGNGDNGNNGGDTEKPDGNGDNTQKPDGNGDTEKPDGNGDEQKPENPDNGNNGDNTQKPDDTNKPDDTQKPEEQKPNSNNQNTTTGQQVQATTDTKTAPKTGDPTTALPFMGAGLSSLGIALGAIFKKRR